MPERGPSEYYESLDERGKFLYDAMLYGVLYGDVYIVRDEEGASPRLTTPEIEELFTALYKP